MEDNYYGKHLGDNWKWTDAYLLSFYELDRFINDWSLLNEYISRFLIILIFKNSIRKNINYILKNNGENEIKFSHSEDSGRCIFNFGKEKFIVAYEVNDPKICVKCSNKIKQILEKDIDIKSKSLIKKESDLLKRIIFKLKTPRLRDYLTKILFINPVVNFFFSGLIFGTIINVLFYYLENQFNYMINPLILFMSIGFILIFVFLILSYFYRKNKIF